MTRKRFLAICGFAIALALPAAGQEIMFASTASGNPQGALGTVNQINGAFTLLGDPTSSGNLVGISFDSTGRLFGVNVQRSGSTLLEINPTTGLLIATIGPIQDSSQNDIKMVDLATQPGTDTLFGIDDTSGNNAMLWTIDKSTAVATLVGNTGLSRGGIAFAPDGTLFLANVDDKLARLDPATGLPVGMPINLSDCIDGLAVRPSDGALFGTACDSNDIYGIDTTTGMLTLLGSPSDDTADLAFQVGSPGTSAPTLSLAGIAALATILAATGVVLLARQRSSARVR